MIIRDQRLEHGLKACTTVFQLLPLQNLHFLMTKPPTQKVLTIFLFLISKLHWWTRTKVTYPYPTLYYLPKYSRGGGVRTVPTRGDLKPLQIPVYLLMKHFRNWRARQPTNHYFEQPRTAATGKNCPPIPDPNQGMTLIPWVAKRQSYLYFTLVNFLKVSQPKCIFLFLSFRAQSKP